MKYCGILSSSAAYLATDDHGTQASRHQDGHDDVNHEKARYRRHGKEVHVASGIVSAEERRELLHLHRFPDGNSGKHDDDAGDNDTEIKKPLNPVIDGRIFMGELSRERRPGIGEHVRRTDGNELAPEP